MLMFNGMEYPSREVAITMDGERRNVVVSVERLSEAVFPSDEDIYPSDEARQVDEDIFGYVPDEMMDATDSELAGFIEENLL